MLDRDTRDALLWGASMALLALVGGCLIFFVWCLLHSEWSQCVDGARTVLR